MSIVKTFLALGLVTFVAACAQQEELPEIPMVMEEETSTKY